MSKGKDQIPCQFGGTKESEADCKFPKSRGDIDPGDVWTTSPTAGRPLAGKVVKGKYVPPVVGLKVYDTAKDLTLPKVPDKPKVYGDTCPLGGSVRSIAEDGEREAVGRKRPRLGWGAGRDSGRRAEEGTPHYYSGRVAARAKSAAGSPTPKA